MTDPAGMRRGYRRGQLDESTIAPSWLAQFRLWFDEASTDPAVAEANAFQLATTGADGRPSVRTVLLKGLDERGIVFYTNYESAKANDIDAVPYAAAVFAWIPHERQVRLSGPIARVDAAETAAYFRSRPRGAQLGASASPQSQVIASRDELERAFADADARWAGQDVPVPTNWGGYRLAPEMVEFWQGRDDRLHDRLRFRLVDATWHLERLAP